VPAVATAPAPSTTTLAISHGTSSDGVVSGNAHQLRHLSHRPVLDVQQPPGLALRAPLRPERLDSIGELRPGQCRFRRVCRAPPVGGDQGGQQQLGVPAAAQPQRGLPAGDPPQPAARALQPVTPSTPPDRQERLLQHVLHIGGAINSSFSIAFPVAFQRQPVHRFTNDAVFLLCWRTCGLAMPSGCDVASASAARGGC